MAELSREVIWLDVNRENDLYRGCATPAQWSRVRNEILSANLKYYKDCDILEPWQEYWEEDICQGCVIVAKKVHQRQREKRWQILPELFDLPPWNELENE